MIATTSKEKYCIENDLSLSDRDKTEMVVSYLKKGYDISIEEAKKVVDLLGNDAIKYTECFFDSSLERNLYLLGAASISQGIISLKEIIGIKRSPLEVTLKETSEKFNLGESQLNQKDYRRFDKITGIIQNADLPYSEKQLQEHLFSRLDRLED